MRRAMIFMVVLGALLYAAPAKAQRVSYTGNDLLNECQRDAKNFDTGCFMYINGFVNGFEANASNKYFSIPDNVTVGEMMDVVVKYLENHPEKRHLEAGAAIVWAFSDAYPIKGKQ